MGSDIHLCVEFLVRISSSGVFWVFLTLLNCTTVHLQVCRPYLQIYKLWLQLKEVILWVEQYISRVLSWRL